MVISRTGCHIRDLPAARIDACGGNTRSAGNGQTIVVHHGTAGSQAARRTQVDVLCQFDCQGVCAIGLHRDIAVSGCTGGIAYDVQCVTQQAGNVCTTITCKGQRVERLHRRLVDGSVHIGNRAAVHHQWGTVQHIATGSYASKGRVIHHVHLQLIACKRNSRITAIHHIHRTVWRDSGSRATIGLQIPASTCGAIDRANRIMNRVLSSPTNIGHGDVACAINSSVTPQNRYGGVGQIAQIVVGSIKLAAVDSIRTGGGDNTRCHILNLALSTNSTH